MNKTYRNHKKLEHNPKRLKSWRTQKQDHFPHTDEDIKASEDYFLVIPVKLL